VHGRRRLLASAAVFEGLIASATLLFVLLNPFMMTVYLIDLIRSLGMKEMTEVMIRATLISGVVFVGFALGGNQIFEDVLGVHFASFQIFGGLMFLAISLRSMLYGAKLMTEIRGEPAQIAGAVAMPFMIGPGTVSAAVVAGAKLEPGMAVLAILIALVPSTVGVLLLKKLHDYFQESHAGLVERYIEIVGRVTAVLIGTIAVDLIARGIVSWVDIAAGC